mmetsp:Transcript_4814/g.14376  ORF Transcript_4814/g.14376 Transcript_4814/m.14376 type:complete len:224 (-) Transcript_4814:508-1179(-)
MTDTARTGKLPAAVSPESMTQSVPSITALATSVASALVGLGFFTMDSSICVAVTTGLPILLHFCIMSFWATQICSVGISIPRSPLATMMASVLSRISSKLMRPSWFSILEMILMSVGFPVASQISLLMLSRSSAFLTKDAAMKSMSFGTPQPMMSCRSFSVRVGRSTFTPGRLQFFLSPSLALLVQTQRTVPASMSQDRTSSTMDPSAMRMELPGFTSLGKLL